MKNIKNFIDLLKKITRILDDKQKKQALIILVLSIIGALLETLGVSAILPLVQVMLEPDKIFENRIVSELLFVLNIYETDSLIFFIAIFTITIYVLKNAYLCFLSWIRAKYTAKVQQEVSVKMLHSYMKRGYIFFRQTNTSTLIRAVKDSVASVQTVIQMFMKILTEVLTIFCIFVYILITDWILAVSMVGLVGVCLVGILSIFKKVMTDAGRLNFKSSSEVNKWLLQLFSGIKEVLVFGRKDYFVSNYEKSFTNLQKAKIRQTVSSEVPAYLIEGTCVMGIIFTVCVRMTFVTDMAEFLPQLAVFAMAAFRLLPSVGRIAASLNSCIFSIPAVTEVYDNIEENRKYAECNKENKTTIEEKISFNEKVDIDNIVWRYPDGIENVLDHVNLSINKGDSIALVGPSGAGKSTLADIILGLLYPQEGGVLVDGKNITNNGERTSIISFVPQLVYLIDDTVRRNVAFGIKDAEISDDLVLKALEQAHMKEYILSLPKGLDTVVGERGVRFSGGQMQRLAIARALYTNPEILVLDEATSALDSETESAVMESIEALQGHKTLIIIAHRLTTIKKCNKIYEIVNGCAVERKYEELV